MTGCFTDDTIQAAALLLLPVILKIFFLSWFAAIACFASGAAGYVCCRTKGTVKHARIATLLGASGLFLLGTYLLRFLEFALIGYAPWGPALFWASLCGFAGYVFCAKEHGYFTIETDYRRTFDDSRDDLL